MAGAQCCVAGAIFGSLVCGCAVGPDFRPPAPPGTSGYTATALPLETLASPGAKEVSQRLAGGMLSSTLLAIPFVPVFYVVMDSVSERLQKWRNRRKSAGPEGKEPPEAKVGEGGKEAGSDANEL